MKTRLKDKVTFAEYDTAEIIKTKEDIIAFLEGAIAENDPEYLLKIIDDISRSKGMTQVARELGVTRQALYQSLTLDENPSFKTVFKLLDLWGLQVKFQPKGA
jgi:probable addiction module antidote protein